MNFIKIFEGRFEKKSFQRTTDSDFNSIGLQYMMNIVSIIYSFRQSPSIKIEY